MAFEYVVATILKFGGNGPQYLAKLTQSAEKAALATERLAKMATDASDAMSRFERVSAMAADTTATLGKGVSSASGRFTRQAAAIDKAAVAMDRYALASDRARASGAGSGTGGGSGGSGAGGGLGIPEIGGLLVGASLLKGVQSAGNLQAAQKQLGVTGLPASRLGEFQSLALKMSTISAMSIEDAMNLLKVAVVNGLPIQKLHGKALTDYALSMTRYADINYLATGDKHLEFEKSIEFVSGLAHDLQIYDPSRMQAFTEKLYKTSYQFGLNPMQMATQVRAFAPRAHAAGISDDDILDLYALTARFGLGKGRGGTGLNMLLKNLQDPRGTKKVAALTAMGILDANGNDRFIDAATGNIDLTGPNGLLEYVAAFNKRMHLSKRGALANKLVSMGFDTNAANVLEAIGTSGGLDQLRTIRASEAKMPNLQSAQELLMSGLNNQTKLLTSNFATLNTMIAKPLVDPITRGIISPLAGAFGAGAQFFANHEKLGAATGAGMAAFGAWAVLRITELGHGIIGGFIRGGNKEAEHATTLFARIVGRWTATISRGIFLPLTKGLELLAKSIAGFVGKNLFPKISQTLIDLASKARLAPEAISGVGDAIGGFVGRLLSFAKFLNPLVDVAALTLTVGRGSTGADNDLTPAQRHAMAVRSAAYRRSQGEAVEVHGDMVVHVHANSKEGGHAAAHGFVNALRDPHGVIQRAKNSTRLPAPAFGVPALATGRH